MNYNKLSQKDTDIWLKNVNNTLELVRKCISEADRVSDEAKEKVYNHFHRNIFTKIYALTMYNMYKPSDIFIGLYSGAMFTLGGIFSDTGCTLEQNEIDVIVAVDDIMDNEVDFILEIVRCWNVYSTKPFDITQQDIIDYMRILRTQERCKKLLTNLGTYDETYNVVEDSQCRC